MGAVITGARRTWLGAILLAGAVIAPPPAIAGDLEQAFDRVFAGQPAQQQHAQPLASLPLYPTELEARVASLADAGHGRIGVAAMDLGNGKGVTVLGDQPFPLASTGKVAIVATFLDLVDQGRLRLSDSFPMMYPTRSHRLSGEPAPERAGASLPAVELIELAITRSDNHATDALLAAIGGPQAVDRWLRAKAGITGMRIDRTIATLVRDDGAVNPATTIDVRDSTTPQAMVRLLAGIYRGEWLSQPSQDVLLGAMGRCQTGLHRMRAAIPDDALLGHKTGTLANTSSDVGIIRTPDGHTIALAIYVTGQGSKPGREARIAAITRAIYDGYQTDPLKVEHTAER